MNTFLQRFASSIHGALSGFDRVRFRGTQRLLANLRGMAAYLSFHGILLKHFGAFVCVTGRDLLARQPSAAGIAFDQRDNCLASVADVPRAQALLDAQVHWGWSAALQRLLGVSHPHWQQWPAMERPYYWSAEV